MTSPPHPFVAVLAGTIATVALAITGGAALATGGPTATDRLEPLVVQVAEQADTALTAAQAKIR